MISDEFKKEHGLVTLADVDGFEEAALRKFADLILTEPDKVVAGSSHNDHWAMVIEQYILSGRYPVIRSGETDPIDGISEVITVYGFNAQRIGYDSQCGVFLVDHQAEEIINAVL
jgi:hypothetical protein